MSSNTNDNPNDSNKFKVDQKVKFKLPKQQHWTFGYINKYDNDKNLYIVRYKDVWSVEYLIELEESKIKLVPQALMIGNKKVK